MDAWQMFAALSLIVSAAAWLAVPLVRAMRRRAAWREVRRCMRRGR